jgi:hypothetical protein
LFVQRFVTQTSLRTLAIFGSTLVVASFATTLGGRAQAPSTAREAGPAAPTFTEDVAPIIFNNCTSCHRQGEAAPFPLTSYADVRPRGRQIAAVARSRQMPPWKADHSDFAFAGDNRLSEAEIATLERWVVAGMPQGDPARLPSMPDFTAGWQLGEPDLVVRMPAAFSVPAAGRDIYRNFVLPLNLDHDVWVKGVDFRPSAPSVTHHSLFFLDSTGDARRQDAQDPVPGYNGGMGGGFSLAGLAGGAGAARGARGARGAAAATPDNGAPLPGTGGSSAAGGSLGGWAPGAQPHLLPDDLAFFVPKGSDLILSTHFHPSGVESAEASTVGLYFADRAPSKAFTSIQLPPVFGLLAGINIPAGASDYTISDSFTIPVAVRAFGISGHAHYLAKTMTMTATLPGGAVKTLVGITDWDFAWQGQYQFADYVDLPAGTRLDVTVTYDNSAANKRNPSDPPRRVTWGEQSTDEMGSISLQVVAASRGELPQLQAAVAQHLREKAQNAPLLGALLMRGAGARR